MKMENLIPGRTGAGVSAFLGLFLILGSWLSPLPAFPADKRETVEILINRGVLNSEKGDWAQAKSDFEQALQIVPDSDQVLTYLGQAYYQMGDFEKSAQIFRQLIDKSPARSEYHLSLGLALLKLGQKEDAQKEFDLAESAPAQPGKSRFWRVKLSTGTQYDSNLVMSPRGSDLPGKVSSSWGIRQTFLGFGEVSHPFSKRFKGGLNYTYYLGWNFDRGRDEFDPHEYNMMDHSFALSGSYEGDKYLARLDYVYDVLLAGSSFDLYSQSHAVAPAFNYLIRPSLISFLGYEFKRDIFHVSYASPELSQDGMSHAMTLRQYILLGADKRGTIAPEYRFKANQAEGSDFEYLSHRAGASFDYRYLGLTFSLAGSYEYRGFSNENTEPDENGDDVKRRDDEIGVRAGVDWTARFWGADWGVDLGLNLTENFSNIEKYSYERLLLMLNLNFMV